MNPASKLREGILALGAVLPGGAEKRLLAYQALLAKWNAVYNLTAIRDPMQAISHHLLDSLAVLTLWPPGSRLRLIDVGSGGGLPGVPLAIARPAWQFTLLDSNEKKTAFLRQVAIELELSNVKVVTERVERFGDAGAYDVVISRAFADLSDFAYLAGALAKSGGALVAMKGTRPRDECDALPASWKIANVQRLYVPGLEADRHVVTLLKAA